MSQPQWNDARPAEREGSAASETPILSVRLNVQSYARICLQPNELRDYQVDLMLEDLGTVQIIRG
jgi:hypothetical protein